MDQKDLLDLLIGIDFDASYRAICAAHPYLKDRSPARAFTRAELFAAFSAIGVTPDYHQSDRTLTVPLGEASGRAWRFALSAPRSGHVDMAVTGWAGPDAIGATFAVLAYESRRQQDPGLRLDGFSGPAPYPRPALNGDPAALNTAVGALVSLAREVFAAIRDSAASPAPQPD